jgi:flavin reductase (DIM6/NTAB) family NADH-FMN oxidoreductase RutF
LLEGCLARFECERYAEYDGGDHAIIVGRVLKASVRTGLPLLFFGGQFGQFAASA